MTTLTCFDRGHGSLIQLCRLNYIVQYKKIQYNAEASMGQTFSKNPTSSECQNKTIWQCHIHLEFQIVNRGGEQGALKGGGGGGVCQVKHV